MELEGVVQNGVVVPDDPAALPDEGTRVRIAAVPAPAPEPPPSEKPQTFGEVFARFKGACPGLPADMADQHEHYRLGTPKR